MITVKEEVANISTSHSTHTSSHFLHSNLRNLLNLSSVLVLSLGSTFSLYLPGFQQIFFIIITTTGCILFVIADQLCFQEFWEGTEEWLTLHSVCKLSVYKLIHDIHRMMSNMYIEHNNALYTTTFVAIRPAFQTITYLDHSTSSHTRWLVKSYCH